MSDPLAQNIHACHTQNYDEYKSSSFEMLSGLRAYNNHEYGRNLPDFWAMLCNLPEEQSRFFSLHFAQSMTGLSYSCQPLDLWIEVTMNLGSSLKAGWLHLLQNDKQLFSTIRNTNNVSRIRLTLESNLKSKRKRTKHVDCQPARMRKDEKAVQDIQTSLNEFEGNPFDISIPTLRSIQSGIKASDDVIHDLSVALLEGRKQVDTFLEERVYSKMHSIKDRLAKNKRLNFKNNQTVTASNKTLSQAQMEGTGLASVIQLAEGSGALTLENIFKYRVTEECLPIFNVDGSIRHTTKSKLLEHLNLQPVLIEPSRYGSIVDMGLIWRLATPTSDDRETKRRDGTVYKWKDYLDKICSLVHSRHQDADKIFLVNDRYDIQYSIKDDERDRRSAKHPDAGNKFPKPDDKFPGATEFNIFMSNTGNKVRLQALVSRNLKNWGGNEHIIYIEGGKATNIVTGENDPKLYFNHSEADTMMLTLYAKLRSEYPHAIIIDSEDTDVYVQAAYVAKQEHGNLYMKRKKQLVDCDSLLPDEISDIIIAAHVISGSDHTSGFFNHGKISVMKSIKNDAEARELLSSVGEEPELSNDVASAMKEFVLTKIYNSEERTCASARAVKWRKQKKKNSMYLPPDKDSLQHHLERTNYITYCQRNFQLTNHPSPLNHGWELLNGKCRPVRYKHPALPMLVQTEPILSDNEGTDSQEEETEYEESSEESDVSDID